jgi:hypothetical protein
VANLGTFIDGAYDGTYGGVSMGITENGFDLIKTQGQEVIEDSDQYGRTVLDYFFLGGACQLRCDCKEFIAGALAAMWPWGGLGFIRNTAAPIGRRASDAAQALVLTATANTPAASTTPSTDTFTATYAVQAPSQSSTIRLSTTLRRVPVFLQLLPYVSGGNTIWFSTT